MKIKKLCILSLISFVCLTGCTTNQQQNSEDKQTEQKITELKKEKKSFEKEEDRNKKLDILKKTIQNQNKYKKEESTEKKVISNYKKTIQNMREYFVDDYDERLSENKIDGLDSITDSNEINDKKENLTALKQDIDNEHDYTLSSEKKYQSYTEEISNTLDLYNTKLEEISKQKENQSVQTQNTAYASPSDALEYMDDTIVQNGRHFENNTFSLDIPNDWEDGTWSISVDEDVFEFDRSTANNILRAIRISHMPNTEYPSGGGATIYLLNDVLKADANKEWYDDKVGYDGDYGSVEIGRASNGLVVYVMNVAASAVDDGREHTTSLATITLK